MNRRDFLKLIGITPLIPSILMVKPKELTVANAREFVKKTVIPKKELLDGLVGCWLFNEGSDIPIGIGLEDIPKDGYGWIQIWPPNKKC